MKRFILLLTILYPFCLFAQDESYRPFIEEGKMWYITGDDSYFRHYIEGDTIVAVMANATDNAIEMTRKQLLGL